MADQKYKNNNKCMTHYRMLDRAPSVVITSNRNELKLYQNNTVYLNDGDNFELRFFNPLKEKIGVEIMFNGIKKGDSYLVLNPGQDVILDRFLDEQRKMLFETYSINGNNKEAVEAIQENGIITFNFYKEQFSRNYKSDVDINYNFPPKPRKHESWNGIVNNYNTTNNNYYLSGLTSNSCTSGISGSQGSCGTQGTTGHSGLPHYKSTPRSSATFSTNNSTSTSTISTQGFPDYSTLGNVNGMGTVSFSQDYWFPTSSTVSPNFAMFSADLEESELETGRIEKGDISSQSLRTINAQFAINAFHSISYKLLPYSAMNKTIGEIREYCGDCGYRLRKQTWKFCPKCGEKIN